jgi:hypothetical protein
VAEEPDRQQICLGFVTGLGIRLGPRKVMLSYQMFSGARNTTRYFVDHEGVERERDNGRRRK